VKSCHSYINDSKPQSAVSFCDVTTFSFKYHASSHLSDKFPTRELDRQERQTKARRLRSRTELMGSKIDAIQIARLLQVFYRYS
jgi:hypothetical protein